MGEPRITYVRDMGACASAHTADVAVDREYTSTPQHAPSAAADAPSPSTAAAGGKGTDAPSTSAT
eukprot:4464030-Prymnesium_polylepis.1